MGRLHCNMSRIGAVVAVALGLIDAATGFQGHATAALRVRARLVCRRPVALSHLRCGVDRGDFRGDYGELPEGQKGVAEGDARAAETLLRVEVENYNLTKLRDIVRTFPFAAVLPVQPLLVFPTDTGIDIVFRKKPTSERGSTDGGLIIKVEEKSVLWDPHRVPGATRARGLEGARPSAETAAADAVKMPRGRKGGEDLYDVPRATVSVLRNTEGQMVSKQFSEKLVVKKLMEALTQMDEAAGRPVSVVSSFVALAE